MRYLVALITVGAAADRLFKRPFAIPMAARTRQNTALGALESVFEGGCGLLGVDSAAENRFLRRLLRVIPGQLREEFADSVVARAFVAKPEDLATANPTLCDSVESDGLDPGSTTSAAFYKSKNASNCARNVNKKSLNQARNPSFLGDFLHAIALRVIPGCQPAAIGPANPRTPPNPAARGAGSHEPSSLGNVRPLAALGHGPAPEAVHAPAIPGA